MPGQSCLSGWVRRTPSRAGAGLAAGLAAEPPARRTGALRVGGLAVTRTPECDPCSGLRGSPASGTGRTTSIAGLSSRRPRYTAWRTRPPPDHPTNCSSATRIRPHPDDAAIRLLARDQQAGRGFVVDEIELHAQRPQLAIGKAGADAAGVMQVAVRVVEPHLQRADPHAAPTRWGPAQDHELLPPGAFQLHPVMAPPRAIGRIRPLGDDPLQPHRARLPPHRAGIPLDMVAEPHGRSFQKWSLSITPPCAHPAGSRAGPNR